MNNPHERNLLAVWVAITFAPAASFGAAGDVLNLDTLGSGGSHAYRLNNAGVVVGESTISGASYHAFRHPGFGGGTMQDLGTFGGTKSSARAINDSGTIGGFASAPSDSTFRGFTAAGAGTLTNVGSFGGSRTEVHGINASGEIVGNSHTPGNALTRAFKLSPGGQMMNLGGLHPTRESAARAINSSGAVVGYADDGQEGRAFYHPGTAGGTMFDLGSLGGTISGATDINDAGVIVGYALRAVGNATHAFRLPSIGSTMQDLGTFGGTFSHADAINEFGYVVGRATTPDEAELHAALWRPNNTSIDLDVWLDSMNPSAGANWTLHAAFDINDFGLVVGQGLYDDGPGGMSDGFRGFVLDASVLVPEPQLGLPLAGLITFAGGRRVRWRTRISPSNP